MSLESLNTWKQEWANLPLVADDTWKQNLADFFSARLDGLLKFQTYQPDDHFDYVFNQASFISALAGVDFSNPIALSAMANGLEASFIANTALVKVGTSIGPPGNPATTYSVVTSTVFDAPSLTAMKAEILLADTTPVANALDSDFPRALRDGILLVTATISGSNSVAPTPGPLVDAARGVE